MFFEHFRRKPIPPFIFREYSRYGGMGHKHKCQKKIKEAKTYLTNTYIFSTCHTADIVQYHPQI